MKRTIFSLGLAIITLFAFSDPVHQTRNILSHCRAKYMMQDTIPVKVQLEQTTIKDMPVLFIADTAATDEAIAGIFGKDYGELMQHVQQNKLQPYKFMAFYHTTQAPWLLDVAVEVNQIPVQLSGRVQSRIQKGGEVIVAHIWGPYNRLGQAYAQIDKWLKENNRKAKEAPFEVYVNDPSTVKDPSEIQTDVYQPIE